jgi:hypothetical protein
MVQELLPFLPQTLSTAAVAACAAGVVVGLFLWLLGGVWSRGIVTLLAVALGGWLGTMLPRWYFWPINSMSLAVLGAVGLGVFAFAAPRVWVGLLLGTVLALWAGLGVWMNLGGGDQPFPWRQDWEVREMTPPQHAADLWQRLPEPVQRAAPFAAATALISALAIALLWPRLVRALAFSLGGVTLAFAGALLLLTARRPGWLELVPTQTQVQAAVLAVMALAGLVVQWQFIPSRRPPVPPSDETAPDETGPDTPAEPGRGGGGSRPVGMSVM